MKTIINTPLPDTIPEVIQSVEKVLKSDLDDYGKRCDIMYLMGVLQAIHNEIEFERGVA
jgi:hypothetical protein